MEVGDVASMRYVKDGIREAKLVMHHIKHTLLVGEQASFFAISMALPGHTNLSSSDSIDKWTKWRQDGCQRNFWENVKPIDSCDPYHPIYSARPSYAKCSNSALLETIKSSSSRVGIHNHDTTDCY